MRRRLTSGVGRIAGRTALALVLGTAASHAAAQESPAAESAPAVASNGGDTATPQRSFSLERVRGLARELPRSNALPDRTRQALPGYEEGLRAWEAEMNDYRTTITEIVESEYRRRRTEIATRYGERIEAARVQEREQRARAIADFERFLARYPSSQEYTPDVMFRLAELLYERSTDEYDVANQEYARLEDRYLAGILPELPDPPEYDYTPTIRVFTDLAARFPDYRQIDGVYYLMGASWDRMGEIEEGVALFEKVGTEYPESAFAQESWLRVGEYHFDFLDYEEALVAYERAESYGESRLYDKILFKLGWSTYLLNEYDRAIGHFTDLLEYYVRKEAESATEQRDLEEESLQYFAVTLAEEDWDLDGEIDADFILPRVERYVDLERPWAIHVLSRLAARLDSNERILASASIYRLILDTYPLDPENPRRHDTLVRILGRGNEEEQAVMELSRLAQLYAPGTPWYQEQERLGNIEEMEYAEQLVRGGLLESATLVYANAAELAQRAAATGDPVLENQAIEQFRVAGRLFNEFLEQYPSVEEAYEVRVYYAQSLYFSLQFAAAAEQYEEVRDSRFSDEYRETAASQAVLSWVLALRTEIDAGRLEARALPEYGGISEVEGGGVEQLAEEQLTSSDDAPREAPINEPIPALSLRWAASAERFHALRIRPEDDPDQDIRNLFAVGVLYYEYRHYDAARERFIAVLDDCRPINETGYAAAFIIESFAQTGDIEGLRFWQGELERRQACVPENLRRELAQDLQSLAMGELARRAEELMREERYEEAAEEYSRLAAEYADNREMAPRGLFNAGLIYEQNLSRYEAAIQQFERLVRDYPESEYMDDSLVRIAVNAKKFFDFDKAVDTFQQLDALGFSDPDGVEYPILDAAELLQYSQRRAEAAEAYLEFATRHPNDPRAARSVYTAGVLFAEDGNARRMLETFERFRRTYGNARGNTYIDVDAAYIDTLHRAALHHDQAGDRRNADNFYRQILSEYAVRMPTAPRARYAAGEAAYRDVMRSYDQWAGITLGTTVQQQRQGMERRQAQIPALIDGFGAVSEYGSADWTVCALYMRGRIPAELSDLVASLPIPDAFRNDPDAEDEYRLALDDVVLQLEDAALAQWEEAYPVMQQLGVVNDCTMDTTRRLNRLRGARYPLLKQSIEFTETQLFSPQSFVRMPNEAAPAPRTRGDAAPGERSPVDAFNDDAFDDDPFFGD